MIREARSITVTVCGNPKCRCLHISLNDENEETFAIAAVIPEQVASFVANVQAAAYMIAAEKDDPPIPG